MDDPFLIVLGIGVVILLFFMMPQTKGFLKKLSGSEENPTDIEPIQPPEKAESVAVSPEDNSLDIIAVITAAIAASLNVPEDKFIIRSIKRTNSWNEAAKRERQTR